jgi:hypothetical protein
MTSAVLCLGELEVLGKRGGGESCKECAVSPAYVYSELSSSFLPAGEEEDMKLCTSTMGGYSTFKKPTANLWPFSILSGPHSA